MSDDRKTTSLADLDSKLKAAREKQVSPHAAKAGGRGSVSGAAVGLRIAIDFIAGIAVGVGIGLFLDAQFGTKPWMLIVFIVLGFCAGLLNVIRTGRQLEEQAKRAKQAEQKAE